MTQKVGTIDLHKKVLTVVAATVFETVVEGGTDQRIEYERRRFGSGASERAHVTAWLQERGVEVVVMESTAQYWKPVWLDLEPHFKQLHLAQAFSNKAPKGRKDDFGDAKRLARRFVAGELTLSFVPDAEQRSWRTMTRSKLQLVRDRVRLQNQLEALLEEARIKVSSVIGDLLGASGRRILEALAEGQTDPVKLAELGDDRLKCGRAELVDALTGRAEPVHLEILKLYRERPRLLDRQIGKLHQLVAGTLKKHRTAVIRLAEIPGLGVDSAQQIIAEVGVDAKTSPSAGGGRLRGGYYSGKQRDRGTKPQFPIAKGEPVSATDPDSGGAGGHQEKGLSLPECVQSVQAPPWL